MTTEAQVAMLMLRLLLDNPPELKKVLDYIKSQVEVRKAILETGSGRIVSREEILGEFEEKFGLIIDFLDEEPAEGSTTILAEEMTHRTVSLPGGAKFRLG